MRQYYRFLCATLLLGGFVLPSSVWTADALDKGAPTKDLGGAVAKISVVAVDPPNDESESSVAKDDANKDDANKDDVNPSKISVKVWFQLADSKAYVNPLKYRWSPNEEFYVYVEAAKPAYVYLFQVDDKTKESTQVFPTDKSRNDPKQTLCKAGVARRLPVRFATDDNDEDETISIVVVRADGNFGDAEPEKPAPQPTDTGSDAAAGTLKSISDGVKASSELSEQLSPESAQEIVAKIARANGEDKPVAKFHPVGPVAEAEEKSSDEENVCFYMFGAATVGRHTFTIIKK